MRDVTINKFDIIYGPYFFLFAVWISDNNQWMYTKNCLSIRGDAEICRMLLYKLYLRVIYDLERKKDKIISLHFAYNSGKKFNLNLSKLIVV